MIVLGLTRTRDLGIFFYLMCVLISLMFYGHLLPYQWLSMLISETSWYCHGSTGSIHISDDWSTSHYVSITGERMSCRWLKGSNALTMWSGTHHERRYMRSNMFSVTQREEEYGGHTAFKKPIPKSMNSHMDHYFGK